jgi:D,D-heptose 1,7-bisphosphate phosphatase
MIKKAVFFDRDGVVIKDHDLLISKEDIILNQDILDLLKYLKKKGYLIFIITNQPVIARGMIDERGVELLNDFLNSLLNHLINKFYYCPHHPNANLEKYRKVCNCRKPESGMLFSAAKDFNISLKDSWMIGDMPSDIIAGKNAGCKTIMLKSPNNLKGIESGKENFAKFKKTAKFSGDPFENSLNNDDLVNYSKFSKDYNIQNPDYYVNNLNEIKIIIR